MRPPIIINEHGDITLFDSVEEAECYMEAQDVDRGEYRVTDSDGVELLLEVVEERVPVFMGIWRVKTRKVRIVEARA